MQAIAELKVKQPEGDHIEEFCLVECHSALANSVVDGSGDTRLQLQIPDEGRLQLFQIDLCASDGLPRSLNRCAKLMLAIVEEMRMEACVAKLMAASIVRKPDPYGCQCSLR